MGRRLFIAIKVSPDADTLNHIYRIVKRLEGEAIKWVDFSGIHLTLKFLGDTEPELIPEIKEALANLAQFHKSMNLKMEGIGVFPNPNKPRVLWLGLEQDEKLTQLAKHIEKEMEKIGFEPEQKEFKPHITLGRIKFIRDLRNLQKLLDQYKDKYFQDVAVEEIILYESTLTPAGARYKALAKFKLL
jgi:2'-5' RNA ligase